LNIVITSQHLVVSRGHAITCSAIPTRTVPQRDKTHLRRNAINANQIFDSGLITQPARPLIRQRQRRLQPRGSHIDVALDSGRIFSKCLSVVRGCYTAAKQPSRAADVECDFVHERCGRGSFARRWALCGVWCGRSDMSTAVSLRELRVLLRARKSVVRIFVTLQD